MSESKVRLKVLHHPDKNIERAVKMFVNYAYPKIFDNYFDNLLKKVHAEIDTRKSNIFSSTTERGE